MSAAADRGAREPGPPRARFRCPACQVFVVGTEAGHCPRCGATVPRIVLPPLSSPDAAPRALPRAWTVAVLVFASLLALWALSLAGTV